MLERRHIQNLSEAAGIESHWGYADRAVPCTNDPGSCAYLDVVYSAHDVGMLYVGVMWGVLLCIVFVLAFSRHPQPTRISSTIATFSRRWLSPSFHSRFLRPMFGGTTRLQVLVIAACAAYLFIFSFAGITYATWITPVKNLPGVYNTRTSLGPFADRVGVLAYALTPLSILLANRESLLSLLTGIPYHHFNFLHRWLGHIILAQASLHTIGWCIVEIKLYQPQSKVAREWIVQPYIIWGVVAMILLLLLWGLSTAWARRAFGYEFFRKAHYVLAMVYIGACWAHWAKLKCFLLPALLLWFADRAARFVRTGLIHYKVVSSGKGMFETIPAKLTYFEQDVVRLDFQTATRVHWEVGQHFYICFPEGRGGIWQSHPFTPLCLPGKRHSYILRAKSGETKRLAGLNTKTTSVIITGPYGANVVDRLRLAPAGLDNESLPNVLCIAGGTGITFVLPVLLHLARHKGGGGGRTIELLWVIRHRVDVDWIKDELAQLDSMKAEGNGCRFTIKIHITGDSLNHHDLHGEACSQSSEFSISPQLPASPLGQPDGQREKMSGGEEGAAFSTSSDQEKGKSSPRHTQRPDLKAKILQFLSNTRNGGPTCVYVSGPVSMMGDVRDQVALCNDARRTWSGDEAAQVELIYDERLE